jgi:chromosome partitioning protein
MEPNKPINRIIQPVQAYLDMTPANNHLHNAEVDLIPEIRRELVLKQIPEPLNGWYDFILIDCPPSLGLLTTNALCASTEVLIPLQSEYFAMRGLQTLLETVEKVKSRLNPDLELLGISNYVLNRHYSRPRGAGRNSFCLWR